MVEFLSWFLLPGGPIVLGCLLGWGWALRSKPVGKVVLAAAGLMVYPAVFFMSLLTVVATGKAGGSELLPTAVGILLVLGCVTGCFGAVAVFRWSSRRQGET